MKETVSTGMYSRSFLQLEVLCLVIKIRSELLHIQLTSMKRKVKRKCCDGLEEAKQASAFQCEPVTCQNWQNISLCKLLKMRKLYTV